MRQWKSLGRWFHTSQRNHDWPARHAQRDNPGRRINTRQLFLLTAGASFLLDYHPVICRGVLPGLDLCVASTEDLQDETAVNHLWPTIEGFIERWIDVYAGQTKSLEYFVPHVWVCLSRNGAEPFADAAMSIERMWPRGLGIWGV